MDEETAFLHGILTHSSCDVHRLAYADWLQERGTPEDEARAEFLRRQIARSGDDPGVNVTPDEQTLLDAHESSWRHWLPERMRGFVGYRRGFPTVVECNAVGLLGSWEQGPILVPIEELTVHVTSASMTWLQIEKPIVLPPLRSFTVRAAFTLGEFLPRILGRLGPFEQLEHLEIHDETLHDHLLTQLDPAVTFPSLLRLNLSHCRLTDETAEQLAVSAWADGLTELDLRGHSFSPTRVDWLRTRFGERCRLGTT